MLIVDAPYYFAAVLSQALLEFCYQAFLCEDSYLDGFMDVCISLGLIFHVFRSDKIVTPVCETCQEETVPWVYNFFF